MRAVVAAGPGAVEVRELPEPEVEEPGDAIVRVRVAGICGSDLHFLHGKAPIEEGESLGHEAVGVVEAVGSGVRVRAVGERVVTSFHIACGSCWFCGAGQTQLCEMSRVLGAGTFGGSLGGAQAELVRVPVADVNLLPLPADLDDETGLFVGDVASTAVYTARAADPGPEDTVAVVGCGPLGLLTVQACLARGPARVVAVDREPDRLRSAAAAGAEVIDLGTRNAEMAVAALTHDRGADVVAECVGSTAGFETALDLVRRGGTLVIAGMYAGEVVDAQLGAWWIRALDLRFTGMCPVHSVWHETLDAVRSGRLDPAPLVTDRLTLDDGAEGYRRFEAKEAIKVVLRP